MAACSTRKCRICDNQYPLDDGHFYRVSKACKLPANRTERYFTGTCKWCLNKKRLSYNKYKHGGKVGFDRVEEKVRHAIIYALHQNLSDSEVCRALISLGYESPALKYHAIRRYRVLNMIPKYDPEKHGVIKLPDAKLWKKYSKNLVRARTDYQRKIDNVGKVN